MATPITKKYDKPYSTNRSGYRGVYSTGAKWAAQIRINGRAVHLGTFDTPQDAHRAYAIAADDTGIARKHHSESHGMSKTKLYAVWNTMRMRCSKASQESYRLYGARGIKVCKRWNKFENFYKDMGGSYKEGLTIDRIDNNKGYSPKNCRWATPTEQANNTSRNRYITVDNITRTLSQWSRITGINRRTIAARIDLQGLSPRQAIGG